MKTARAVLDDTITEKEFLANVVRLAQARHWLVYHTHRSERSQPGFPDLCLVRPPRLLFIELKSEKGRASADQQVWLSALGASGAEARLFRPSDWGQIERVLA